eukprot:CAMPEP_0170062102 /NCGR_PEP_ID=MMETSP0019_2-20121128/3448_1 /TAXON_ID=98059 /ORGANISM="Dinobryon sp., Strain UTEXLB2267" /LENGTH=376 /DNA_ID=CAMNT_0010268153 /DNA_START=59 /DNA_END=1189 /DNA_ORIENTATION=+
MATIMMMSDINEKSLLSNQDFCQDLNDLANVISDLDCIGDLWADFDYAIVSETLRGSNLVSEPTSHTMMDVESKRRDENSSLRRKAAFESLLIPPNDVRRRLASNFFKNFLIDDFDEAEGFMASNCTEDFTFVDHLKSGTKSLLPRLLEIHGIENFMSFAKSISAAIPDRVLQLSDTVIRSKVHEDCIICKMSLEGTWIRDILLEKNSQPVQVVHVNTSAGSFLSGPDSGSSEKISSSAISSNKRRRKSKEAVGMVIPNNISKRRTSLSKTEESVAIDSEGVTVSASFEPTLVIQESLTAKTVTESTKMSEISQEVRALIVPASEVPYKFEQGGLLKSIPVNYKGIIKFFLNGEHRIRRVEMVYVHDDKDRVNSIS